MGMRLNNISMPEDESEEGLILQILLIVFPIFIFLILIALQAWRVI